MMNDTEKKAKGQLEQMGWKPKRCNMVGYPDVECSNHRWVEVKRISVGLIIEQSQIETIQSLTCELDASANDKAYLMIYDGGDEYIGLFEIKAIDWPRAGLRLKR